MFHGLKFSDATQQALTAFTVQSSSQKYSLRHLRPGNLGSLKAALLDQLKSFHKIRTESAHTHLLAGFNSMAPLRKSAVNE